MKNKDNRKKKILILGGTMASFDVVETSKRLGYHTVVIDDRKDSPSKLIADESYLISTIDYKQISELIKEKSIDGIFTGPGEFNLINAIKISEANNLPFYINSKQWDMLSDKANFKKLCKDFDIETIKDLQFNELHTNMNEYPIIIKPVDSNSSKGISIVRSPNDLDDAIKYAFSFSNKDYLIAEPYIESEGFGHDVRFIIHNKKAHFSLAGDRYSFIIGNEVSNICALTIFPSVKTKLFSENLEIKIESLCDKIGLKNGVLFLQGLPFKNKVLFHEIGARVSGGNIYKLTNEINSVNELEMLIRYSMNDYPIIDSNKLNNNDPYLKGLYAASFQVLLNPGIIHEISGINTILDTIELNDYIQYYNVGDEVSKKSVGTLSQIFARFKIISNSLDILSNQIDFIQSNLKITDAQNKSLVAGVFDLKRIRQE